MAASMRTIARSAKLLQNRGFSMKFGLRTYLSSAYACNEEWAAQKRNDPLLKIPDAGQYFVDISRRFVAKAKENLAVDVDIFVNSVEGEVVMQEVINLLNRLRRSKHTVHTLPSTACATVRYMLSVGQDAKLIEMLEDRFAYGLFPDVPTMNLLLDHFLMKKGKEREAAKVATEMMLQENPGNEITRVLSLLACIKYLSTGTKASPWINAPPTPEKSNEDDEIEYVRVPNLTNFFFDDHFDLTDPDLVIGKTLLHFNKGRQPGLVKDSVHLVGLARKGQWERMKKDISSVKEICSDAKELCLQRLTEFTETEGAEKFDPKAIIGMTSPDISGLLASAQRVSVPDWFAPQLEKIKVNDASLISLLEAEANNLSPHEELDIKRQKTLFAQWVKDRKAAIDEQRAAIDRVRRIEILRAKKKELVEKEELYYAFENWNKIEMLLEEINKNFVKEEKVEEYVPPEVKKRKQLTKSEPAKVAT
ncbi:uncharacterized protein LOC111263524 [Varroa jacobsoni]|uniref:uncharacterized protein LOC111263524 n=1 Tax=Varroa jacobsoni TaxID=62625 RepID=UPI000BF5E044|nr:uncharacterized protein LOC111263524 [Varroa jacobsoni]